MQGRVLSIATLRDTYEACSLHAAAASRKWSIAHLTIVVLTEVGSYAELCF